MRVARTRRRATPADLDLRVQVSQTRHELAEARAMAGRVQCARHVLTLALTKTIALTLVAGVCGLALRLAALTAALAIDAASHYWADRRTTLAQLAELVGKGEFAGLGDPKVAPAGTGAYALDQSWHLAWLAVTALIAAVGAAA